MSLFHRQPLSVLRRYSRLIRSLSQKDTKVVLSMGGGGVRMFAHGYVLEFLENLGVQPFLSEIWGTSAGAIIGMLYSRGFTPKEIKEEAMRIFHESPIPSPPGYLAMATRLIKDAFLPLHRKQTMKIFHDYQLALLQIVAKDLKKNPPRYDFYCTAFNLETNDNEILTDHPVPKILQGHGIYQVDPLQAVAASSALPIIFKPQVIEDGFGKRTYVDGGMTEEVPTTSLYRKWKLDRELGLERRKRLLVISVDLHPSFASMSLLENWFYQRLPGYEYLLLSINFSDFMRDARTKAQKHVLLEDPNVELWDLNLEMPGGGLLNLDLIPQVLQAAEKSFPPQLAKINKSLLA